VRQAQHMKPELVPEAFRKDVFKNPSKFDEAYNHPAKFQRKTSREFERMKIHQVWEKIKQNNLPSDCWCVKCKWVFEIKRDGVFRACLVACGYSQIPGTDFTDSYSPVVNDVTVRILFIIQLVKGYTSKLMDVETAFLNGDLDCEIYMDCSDGVNSGMDECLKLKKTIYGLVQTAGAFWKKISSVLKEISFEQSLADLCLYSLKSNT
jgi:Reverse transcriptase (RNA-dependent DNA polymerase)